MAFGMPSLTKKKKVTAAPVAAVQPPASPQVAPIGAQAPPAPSPPKSVPPPGPAVPPPPTTVAQPAPSSTTLTPDAGTDPSNPSGAVKGGAAGFKAGIGAGKGLLDKGVGKKNNGDAGEPVGAETTTEDILKDVEDVGEPVLEERKAEAEQETASDFDKAVSELLLGQVNDARNGADTTEEEALIRQMMEDELGKNLVGSRARAGRSGFAASGAQSALEGDLMRTAKQQGLEDILGLRRTEDQRGIDNATKAIGSDIDMRQQAEDEFFNEQLLNTLQSALGIEGEGGDPGAGGDGGGFGPIDGSLPDIPAAIEDAVNQNPTELAASNSQIPDGEPGTMANPKPVDKKPAGAVKGPPFGDGTFMYTIRHDDNGGWTEYFRAP